MLQDYLQTTVLFTSESTSVLEIVLPVKLHSSTNLCERRAVTAQSCKNTGVESLALHANSVAQWQQSLNTAQQHEAALAQSCDSTVFGKCAVNCTCTMPECKS
jgi:hypothetical protein